MRTITEVIKIPLINLEVLILVNHKSKASVLEDYDDGESKDLLIKILHDSDFEDLTQQNCAYIHYTDEKSPKIGYHVLQLHNARQSDVVHEICHLMQTVRNIFWPNQIEREFEAYMTGWIFEQVEEIRIRGTQELIEEEQL